MMRANKALQRTAAPLRSRTAQENWLATVAADRAFPTAVAELARWVRPIKRSVGPQTATTASPSIALHRCRFPRALPVAIGIYPAAGYVFLPLHQQ